MMTERPRAGTGGARRRGSVYLAVLSSTMVVTVIGLSALYAARIQNRLAGANESAAVASMAAQSAMECASARMHADSNWRNTYVNNQWVSQFALGGAQCTFKLVDEIDGNLGDDASQPVRLYGRATAGGAGRTFSVLLKPPPPVEILVNGGIENGTYRWVSRGDCDLLPVLEPPRSGAMAMLVRNRLGSWAGPMQYVTSSISRNVTYDTEVWVKTGSFAHVVNVFLYVQGSSSGGRWYYLTGVAGTSWTRISGSFTPTWSGSLVTAAWGIETAWSSQDIYIDDARLTRRSDGSLTVVPGTLRRVVE